MASADKKNVAKKKEKASPRQREGPDTSTFGECDASDKSKLSQSPGIIKEVKCDMAERRMFSQKIVQSSKFLQMPKSSQCLYFHLGLRADDDGVVEAYSVMNMIKANEDDLKLLVAKGYVVILNDCPVHSRGFSHELAGPFLYTILVPGKCTGMGNECYQRRSEMITFQCCQISRCMEILSDQ